MCSATELLLIFFFSEQQSFGFHSCITELFYLLCNESYQPEVIFVSQDIDFLPVINIVKASIENVCGDLLHLCILMSLSDTEEIIMLSLSEDHNVMQYHWKINYRKMSHGRRSGKGRGDCCF